MLTPKPRRPAPAKRPTAVECKLDGIINRLTRMEKKMSALSDAIASLTAAEQAEHEELVLVLNAVKDGQAKLQEAIDQLAKGGFTAEDLAGIQAAKDQADANVKAMADALATTPPPETPA